MMDWLESKENTSVSLPAESGAGLPPAKLELSEKENACGPLLTSDAGLPPTKKANKSVPLESRFGNKPTTEEELAECLKGFVPKATRESTEWAVRNFQDWKHWRQSNDLVIPEDLLEGRDADALNKWLSLYVKETRHKDGKPFPSRTIDMLLSGLKRHMKVRNPCAVDILSETDPRFTGLRDTRDTVARQLREAGVGATVKHTAVFSATEEEQLWSTGELGVDSPRAVLAPLICLPTIQQTLFHYGIT